MKIIIKKIEISNFRNITNFKSELKDFNLICGNNYIGKTNILNAIAWTLTDKLLDGSNELKSIKPAHSTSELVKVNLLLSDGKQDMSIEKTYQENWVKSRGSDKLSLKGHTTCYKINDLIVNRISDAVNKINDFLGINLAKTYNIKQFDASQSLINPLYIGELLDWKTLRKLIVSIIGEIDSTMVFNVKPEALNAKNLLEKYNYDINDSLSFINQEIRGINYTIDSVKAVITDLSITEDVNIEELKNAEESIAKIKVSIENLKSKKATIYNPEIENLKIKISNLKNEISEQYNFERENFISLQNQYNEKLSTITAKYTYSQNEFSNAKFAVNNKKNEILKITNETKMAVSSNVDLEEKRTELYKEYDDENAREFVEEKNECPKCHYVLNQDDIERKKQQFEKNKFDKISAIVEKGTKIKLRIESNKNLIEDNNLKLKNLNDELQSLTNNLDEKKNQYEKFSNDYFELSKEKPSFVESDILKNKKLLVQSLEKTLAEEITKFENINNPNDKIKDLENQKEQFEPIIKKHYEFVINQDKLESKKIELKSLNSKLIDCELIKESINLFAKTKLEIMNKKIKEFFGDEVQFKLIENNIAEGSWDQVCYPLIYRKNIPFKNGSSSEKILTGVKIIESFKKALHLYSLPVLIDEISELDSTSIKNLKTMTESQIIATKVMDGIEKPTIFD